MGKVIFGTISTIERMVLELEISKNYVLSLHSSIGGHEFPAMVLEPSGNEPGQRPIYWMVLNVLLSENGV